MCMCVYRLSAAYVQMCICAVLSVYSVLLLMYSVVVLLLSAAVLCVCVPVLCLAVLLHRFGGARVRRMLRSIGVEVSYRRR